MEGKIRRGWRASRKHKNHHQVDTHGLTITVIGLATVYWRHLIGKFMKVLNLTIVDRRVFDASFKRMDIDLSYARGSVKEVADELGIEPGRLSKWRQKNSSLVRPTSA